MPIKHKCNAFCAKGQTIFNFLSARYPQRKKILSARSHFVWCRDRSSHLHWIYISPLIRYRSHMPKVWKTSPCPYDLHISVPYHVWTLHTVLVLCFDNNVQCIHTAQVSPRGCCKNTRSLVSWRRISRRHIHPTAAMAAPIWPINVLGHL